MGQQNRIYWQRLTVVNGFMWHRDTKSSAECKSVLIGPRYHSNVALWILLCCFMRWILGEIRAELIDLQKKIQKVNRQNTLLIKQSMKYVDKTLQILSGSGNSGGVYEQSGKVENTPSPLTGIVDQVI